MKYIKQFESDYYDSYTAKEGYLKPGYMYRHLDSDVCYIGNVDHPYSLLCLIMRKNDFEFIEWASWMENPKQLPPLNISLKDYIINNNLVLKTIEALENPKFSSGGNKPNSFKLIKQMKEDLLKDKIILSAIRANKAGLWDTKIK